MYWINVGRGGNHKITKNNLSLILYFFKWKSKVYMSIRWIQNIFEKKSQEVSRSACKREFSRFLLVTGLVTHNWLTIYLLYVWPQFTIGSLKIENLASLTLRLLLGRSNKWVVLPGALSGDHYWLRYDWSWFCASYWSLIHVCVVR